MYEADPPDRSDGDQSQLCVLETTKNDGKKWKMLLSTAGIAEGLQRRSNISSISALFALQSKT